MSIHSHRYIGILLLFAVAFAGYFSETKEAIAERSPIKVISVGPPLDFYDTGRDGCDWQDVPDEAARAFRDKKGVIHFFATRSVNRAMLGQDFGHLSHTCDIAFKGAANPDPSAFDDNGWLTAFYATGTEVFALIHNEFHGSERWDLCPSAGGADCVAVSITEAISKDDGYHFKRYPENEGIVATLPYKFQPKRGSFIGDMNPTNIIKRGEYYYVLVSAIDPYDVGHSGVCLLRNQVLSDPSSWRAWNGKSFSTNFVDPYNPIVDAPTVHACIPIEHDNLFFSLGSVTWSSIRQSYLLVARLQKWDRPRQGLSPGAYLFESTDLIHWSKPTLLFSDAQAGGVTQLYPSLIDPSSSGSNFDTIGDTAILFTKVSVKGEGYKTWRLLARRIKLGL